MVFSGGYHIISNSSNTPSYDEVKHKFTLTFKKPQSKHKMSIKNYDNLFEQDSNILPYSQNFRFVSYRINLHISSCLTKRKMVKLHTSVNFVANMNLIYDFVHLGDSLAYQVPIANTQWTIDVRPKFSKRVL